MFQNRQLRNPLVGINSVVVLTSVSQWWYSSGSMGASFIGISKENKYVEVTERIHSIPVINTDAKDIITNAQRDEMANNQNVDFMVGSFVT